MSEAWHPVVQEMMSLVDRSERGDRAAVPPRAFKELKARIRDRHASDRQLCLNLYALFGQLDKAGMTTLAEQCRELGSMVLHGGAVESTMGGALKRPRKDTANKTPPIKAPGGRGVGLRKK